MKDKNDVVIEIGDIVKIENSPIKSDNATYVVAQDGTSKSYSSSDLTMYKVAKHKNGYSLSKSSYNIAFYPLCNYSNKYHYTREEMNASTIEVLLKANSNAFNLVKCDDSYEAEETEQTYFRAVVKFDDKEIEDTSYPASQKEKIIAFFSNITLKDGETIEIIKQDHTWGYYFKNVYYKLESTKSVKEVKETITTEEQPETITYINNLHYEIKEDTDTRDNSKIYLVKVIEKLDRDEYIKVNQYIKSIGGYYSKFKHAFIFKNDPSELFNSNIKQDIYEKQEQQTVLEEQSQELTEEIKQHEEKPIEFEIEQKDKIWLVKIKDNVPKEKFIEVKRNFAILKGFYSGLYESFIFKYDPTDKIQINT
jgi:hypothetical protein